MDYKKKTITTLNFCQSVRDTNEESKIIQHISTNLHALIPI